MFGDVGSSPGQDKYLFGPQIFILSSVVTLYPLIAVIHFFTIDTGEIVYIGRCRCKKNQVTNCTKYYSQYVI